MKISSFRISSEQQESPRCCYWPRLGPRGAPGGGSAACGRPGPQPRFPLSRGVPFPLRHPVAHCALSLKPDAWRARFLFKSHTDEPAPPLPRQALRLRAPGRMLLSTDRTAIWQKSTPEVISQFTRTSEKSLFPRACCNFLVPFHLQSDYTHPRSHQGTEAESRFNRR